MWRWATSTTRWTWRPAPSTSSSVVLLTWRTRASTRSRSLRSRSTAACAVASTVARTIALAIPPTMSRGQPLDCRDQELGLERLDDPALGAGLLGALDQPGLALGGQHDDRQRLPARICPQLLEHLEAVHPGHVDVADQHRDRRVDLADRVDAIDRFDDLKAGLRERKPDLLPDGGRIIDDEDLLHGSPGGVVHLWA